MRTIPTFEIRFAGNPDHDGASFYYNAARDAGLAALAERDAKLKRADDMLSEVWGAYNRIGDALKERE